jgi:hypothetical protein
MKMEEPDIGREHGLGGGRFIKLGNGGEPKDGKGEEAAQLISFHWIEVGIDRIIWWFTLDLISCLDVPL